MKSPDELSNAKLPTLNRYNVRKLNDSAAHVTPERRSQMSHSASQSFFKRKNQSNLKGSSGVDHFASILCKVAVRAASEARVVVARTSESKSANARTRASQELRSGILPLW